MLHGWKAREQELTIKSRELESRQISMELELQSHREGEAQVVVGEVLEGLLAKVEVIALQAQLVVEVDGHEATQQRLCDAHQAAT